MFYSKNSHKKQVYQVSLLKESFQEKQENERLSFLVKEINSMTANADCNLPGTYKGLSH